MIARARLAGLAVCLVLSGCALSPAIREAKFLNRGRDFYGRKDFARAALEFRNAARAKPGDAEPYYWLGMAYLQSPNHGAALEAFTRATRLNPKDTRAQVQLAGLLAVENNRVLVEDAERRARSVAADRPDDLGASDVLAIAEMRLGKTEEAVDRLKETLRKFPSHLQASVQLAGAKLLGKDLRGAEEVLKKAAAADPQSSAAAMAVADVEILMGKPGEAEGEVHRALRLDPKNGQALLGLAALQVSNNRMAEAEQTFRLVSALPDKRYKPMHAVFLFRSGKRDVALSEFKRLYAESEDDRDARSRLAAAYLALNKTFDAEQLLTGALQKNPKDADALLQHSELDLRSGNFTAAERRLHQVLQLTPDSAQAHFLMATVYRNQGLRRGERQELSDSLRLNPRLLSARLSLARISLAENEANFALELANQAPEDQKSTPALRVERNWALIALGRHGEALAATDSVRSNDETSDLLLQAGVLRLAQRDYAGARAKAERVLQSEPENVKAARLLIQACAAQKQVASGIERLRQLTAARPRSAPLQDLLGQWLVFTGNRADARRAFEAAKSADPSLLRADVALAELDMAEGKLGAARQRLKKVLAGSPRDIPALLILARVDETGGKRAEAISDYRQVLASGELSLPALNNLAYLLAKENPDEALKFAQKAMEIAPENATVQDTLGWVYHRKGLYKMAEGYLKAAFAKEPTPRRQFHLGMLYLKLGSQKEAQVLLAKALASDPGLPRTEEGW